MDFKPYLEMLKKTDSEMRNHNTLLVFSTGLFFGGIIGMSSIPIALGIGVGTVLYNEFIANPLKPHVD